MESWRVILYPFGFLSALCFGGRFIIQWIQSEKAGHFSISPLFWILSLIGNILLGIHSLIQLQYHVCLIQGCNGVIAWRNLNLMKSVTKRKTFGQTLCIMGGVMACVTALFLLQDKLYASPQDWFRVPQASWQTEGVQEISFGWHMTGFLGYSLFSSRFWIQWWIAEKTQKSDLPPIFWWFSLIGTLISLLYFWRIGDAVNTIGPLMGIVPYIRNIMILKHTKHPLPLHD